MKSDRRSEVKKQVLMICNVPGPEYLNNQQRKVLAGYKAKWAKDNEDPACSRLSLIYLSSDDDPWDSKFKPLASLKAHDGIAILGHSTAGELGVRSNSLVYLNREGKKQAFLFTYKHLAEIISLHLLKNKEESHRVDFEKIIMPTQTIRIELAACFTGLPLKGHSGKIISESGVKQLHNELIKRYTACHVVGYNGVLIPCPTKDDLSSFLQFFSSKNPQGYGDDFHRRVFTVPYLGGNYSFNPLLFAPRSNRAGKFETIAYLDPDSTIKNSKSILITPRAKKENIIAQQSKIIKLFYAEINNARDFLEYFESKLSSRYSAWSRTVTCLKEYLKKSEISLDFIQIINSELVLICSDPEDESSLKYLPILKECFKILDSNPEHDLEIKTQSTISDILQIKISDEECIETFFAKIGPKP